MDLLSRPVSDHWFKPIMLPLMTKRQERESAQSRWSWRTIRRPSLHLLLTIATAPIWLSLIALSTFYGALWSKKNVMLHGMRY